ncbi:cell division protein FtsQ/DivIB [Lysobacter ciconiae]|uniref:Cell division protein FtsQ n=1 Tax=Novilysobacter ciconiae TaxID=2781022 RepID=A0A7S6UF14_9GAMM|nr:cell division protein FtsQ/DivIB [Lysobacter ciconiae]QOW19065.1 cell division protein FtsQ/DivIB [Lysobacter ciconiae]
MNALLRLLGWLLAVALVVLPVVGLLNGWVGAEHWPLSKLRATAQFQRVDETLLRDTLLPFARQGYFAVDLDAARAAVAALPWVEHAEVRKRWPDVLEVHLAEHVPFARWDDNQLLSEQGRLFPAANIDIPAELPLLGGPDTRIDEVVELYNQTRTMFAPLGLEVREARLDPRGSWTLRLDNGAEVIVGRHEARGRLNRFVRLLPQLLAQQAQVLARADLRYTNGFALVWADSRENHESQG